MADDDFTPTGRTLEPWGVAAPEVPGLSLDDSGAAIQAGFAQTRGAFAWANWWKARQENDNDSVKRFADEADYYDTLSRHHQDRLAPASRQALEGGVFGENGGRPARAAALGVMQALPGTVEGIGASLASGAVGALAGTAAGPGGALAGGLAASRVGGAAYEGMQAFGGILNSMYEQLDRLGEQKLAENVPLYRDLRASGVDHKNALREVVYDAGSSAAAAGGGITALVGLTFNEGGAIAKPLVRGAAKRGLIEYLKRIGKGGLLEAGEEFVQSGNEAFAAQRGAQLADPTQEIDGGAVLKDAAEGGVIGGLMGGGTSMIPARGARRAALPGSMVTPALGPDPAQAAAIAATTAPAGPEVQGVGFPDPDYTETPGIDRGGGVGFPPQPEREGPPAPSIASIPPAGPAPTPTGPAPTPSAPPLPGGQMPQTAPTPQGVYDPNAPRVDSPVGYIPRPRAIETGGPVYPLPSTQLAGTVPRAPEREGPGMPPVLPIPPSPRSGPGPVGTIPPAGGTPPPPGPGTNTPSAAMARPPETPRAAIGQMADLLEVMANKAKLGPGWNQLLMNLHNAMEANLSPRGGTDFAALPLAQRIDRALETVSNLPIGDPVLYTATGGTVDQRGAIELLRKAFEQLWGGMGKLVSPGITPAVPTDTHIGTRTAAPQITTAPVSTSVPGATATRTTLAAPGASTYTEVKGEPPKRALATEQLRKGKAAVDRLKAVRGAVGEAAAELTGRKPSAELVSQIMRDVAEESRDEGMGSTTGARTGFAKLAQRQPERPSLVQMRDKRGRPVRLANVLERATEILGGVPLSETNLPAPKSDTISSAAEITLRDANREIEKAPGQIAGSLMRAVRASDDGPQRVYEALRRLVSKIQHVQSAREEAGAKGDLDTNLALAGGRDVTRLAEAVEAFHASEMGLVTKAQRVGAALTRSLTRIADMAGDTRAIDKLRSAKGDAVAALDELATSGEFGKISDPRVQSDRADEALLGRTPRRKGVPGVMTTPLADRIRNAAKENVADQQSTATTTKTKGDLEPKPPVELRSRRANALQEAARTSVVRPLTRKAQELRDAIAADDNPKNQDVLRAVLQEVNRYLDPELAAWEHVRGANLEPFLAKVDAVLGKAAAGEKLRYAPPVRAKERAERGRAVSRQALAGWNTPTWNDFVEKRWSAMVGRLPEGLSAEEYEQYLVVAYKATLYDNPAAVEPLLGVTPEKFISDFASKLNAPRHAVVAWLHNRSEKDHARQSVQADPAPASAPAAAAGRESSPAEPAQPGADAGDVVVPDTGRKRPGARRRAAADQATATPDPTTDRAEWYRSEIAALKDADTPAQIAYRDHIQRKLDALLNPTTSLDEAQSATDAELRDRALKVGRRSAITGMLATFGFGPKALAFNGSTAAAESAAKARVRAAVLQRSIAAGRNMERDFQGAHEIVDQELARVEKGETVYAADVLERLASFVLSFEGAAAIRELAKKINPHDRLGWTSKNLYGEFEPGAFANRPGDPGRVLLNRGLIEDGVAQGKRDSNFAWIFLHEAAHAATWNGWRALTREAQRDHDNRFAQDMLSLQNRITLAVWALGEEHNLRPRYDADGRPKNNVGRPWDSREDRPAGASFGWIGMRNMGEIMAYAMSDPQIQALMIQTPLSPELAAQVERVLPRSIYGKISNLYQAFTRWIGAMLGLQRPAEINMLDAVIRYAEAIAEPSVVGIGKGTENAPPSLTQDSLLRETAPSLTEQSLADSLSTRRWAPAALNSWETLTDKARRGLLAGMSFDHIADWFGRNFEQRTDVLGERKNALAELTEATGNITAGATSALRKANEIYRRWAGLLEESPDAFQEMNTLMGESTLFKYDASEPIDSKRNKVATKDEWRAREHARAHRAFNALPEKFQNFYREIRDHYEQERDDVIRLMMRNYLTSNIGLVDSVDERARVADMASDIMDGKLKVDDIPNLTPTQQKIVRTLRDVNRVPGAYFPLRRAGQYVVNYREEIDHDLPNEDAAGDFIRQWPSLGDAKKTVNADGSVNIKGKIVQTEMFETYRDAAARRAELVAAAARHGGEAGLVSDVLDKREHGTLRSMPNDIYESIRTAVAGSISLGSDRAAVQDMIDEVVYRYLPDTFVQKAELRRRYVGGAIPDMQRSFAMYAHGSAYFVAGLEHNWKIQRALKDARETVRRAEYLTEDSKPGLQRHLSAVVKELETRVYNNQEIQRPAPVTNFLRQLNTLWYLVSPSYHLISATQPWTIGLPVLGARYGYSDAAKALGSATGLIMPQTVGGGMRGMVQMMAGRQNNDVLGQLKANLIDRGRQDLADMLDAAANQNQIDYSQIYDLQEGAKNVVGATKGWDKTLELSRLLAHATEVGNRAAVAIATYELEKAKWGRPGAGTPQEIKAAQDAAIDMIKSTMFNYNPSNRSRLMNPRGAATPLQLMWQFKQHAYHMYYLMVSNAVKSFKGASPEERSEARKALLGLLATHMAATGLRGIMFEPIAIAIGLTLMAFGGDSEFEDDIQNWMHDLFGRELGDVIASGVPRAIGIDVTGRMSLKNLMFQNDLGDLQRDGVAAWLGRLVSGPTGGLAEGIGKGISALAEGDSRAWEYMTPKGVRDLLRAYRFYDEGMLDTNGHPIMKTDDMSYTAFAAQALGFRPTEVALATERRFAVMRAQKDATTARSQILEQYARAAPSDRAAIRAREIPAFNRDYPELRINGETLIKSLEARRKRDQNMLRNQGVYVPDTQRLFLDAGRFGARP